MQNWAMVSTLSRRVISSDEQSHGYPNRKYRNNERTMCKSIFGVLMAYRCSHRGLGINLLLERAVQVRRVVLEHPLLHTAVLVTGSNQLILQLYYHREARFFLVLLYQALVKKLSEDCSYLDAFEPSTTSLPT